MITDVILKKMHSVNNQPIIYSLITEDSFQVNMNENIGNDISIKFSGEIFCMKCGGKIKKSFGQGYCYPCFISAPETEECVLKPELCQAHNGIARDMDYAKVSCLQTQFVYLASTDAIKVGVTRNTQIPTRWIDQGASFAIKIAAAPNRYTAGLIEVELKKYFPDKTNWRAMLTNKINVQPNFIEPINKIRNILPPELTTYLIYNEIVMELNYPVTKYPEKINTLDLDKTPVILKNLSGIKGQYLIFKDGTVLNIRKYSGYKIQLEY